MAKKEAVKSMWRWVVTQLFGQNMGFQVAAELPDSGEVSVSMLPEEVTITKITSIHLDPKVMVVRTMPWFLEHFDMVHPVTVIERRHIPFISLPTEKMIGALDDAWRPPTKEEIEAMKREQEQQETKVIAANEDMAKGAAMEATMRQGLFQRLRGGM